LDIKQTQDTAKRGGLIEKPYREPRKFSSDRTLLISDLPRHDNQGWIGIDGRDDHSILSTVMVSLVTELQRLLFLQGQRCFFCEQPISPGEASIQHLAALGNNGTNADDNCVVCCSAVNAMLGNLTVKEKIQVILRHRGAFACPRAATGERVNNKPANAISAGIMEAVLDVLMGFEDHRPRSLKTLRKVIAHEIPRMSREVMNTVVENLKNQGYIAMQGDRVIYPQFEDEISTGSSNQSNRQKMKAPLAPTDDYDDIPF